MFYKKRRVCKEKAIYIDLQHDTFHRYFYTFVFSFQEAGYIIFIRHRFQLIAWLNEHSKLILSEPSVRLTFVEKEAVVRLSDEPGLGKTLLLDPNYFSPSTPDSFHVPMCMHPFMYRLGYFREATTLAHRPHRRMSIFFAGNMDTTAYSDSVITDLFNKLGRRDLYEALQQGLPAKMVHLPRTMKQVLAVNSGKVVIVDKARFSVPMEQLLSTLSQFEFFLSPPGVAMPLCHNTVEAMAVGTIPILEHPELFHPPLQHAKNCIVFQGKDDMLQKVRQLLDIPPDVSAMRNNVLEYYENYLLPTVIAEKIVRRSSKIRKLYLNAEQGSVNLLKNTASVR